MEKLSERSIAASYQQALNSGLIDTDDTAVIFIDLDIVSDRLKRLKQAFPIDTLHAVAIKTNPLTAVLKHLIAEGMGLEAASLGEIKLAFNAGVDAQQLVFDSPAKTVAEIDHLAECHAGMNINADSLEELTRYSKTESSFRLGLRINPLVVADSIASMTVGTADSKFGVPISEQDAIVAACKEWQALECLHLHIGSQYTDLQPTVAAVRKVLNLAVSINSTLGHQKIKTLDIGGGFPVNYGDGDDYFIEDYAALLKKSCPELFDGSYRLITEFGRYVHGNAAWVASRVEYVKQTPKGATLISHAGADMFLREAYNPDHWQHRMLLMTSAGELKGNAKEGANEVSKYDEKDSTRKSTTINTNIAGPLCFGGDFVAKDKQLSQASQGDVLAIRDAGANTFALWSRHCSRPFPKVIAMTGKKIKIVKQRESFERIIDFWS